MSTKKKLLQAAAGSAGGGEALNVEQLFSTDVWEGNGSGVFIENGINLGQSNGSGSAYFTGRYADDNYISTDVSTDFQLSNGDFSIEFWLNPSAVFGENQVPVQFGDGSGAYDPLFYFSGNTLYFYGSTNGTAWDLVNGPTFGNLVYGSWNHVAVTRQSDQLYLYLNGSQINSNTIFTQSFYQSTNQITIGRGQDTKRFKGYISNLHYVKGTAIYTGSTYTLPTGPTSSVANTKLLTLQQDSLLTDNSSAAHTLTEYNGSITSSTFGPFDAADTGKGGMVWTKNRTDANPFFITDTERGATKTLRSNTNAGQSTDAGAVKAFTANGFRVGDDTALNRSGGYPAVSWTFRKARKFFDVVTYTGTGTAGLAVSHNLGTTVGSIFVKRTDVLDNWAVYHREMDATSPSSYYLRLDEDSARFSTTNRFYGTEPTSTEFYVGGNAAVNASGGTYVAYLFAHNDGDGTFGPDGNEDIIKCGSYTGNGSSDGPEIDLGFEPQWVLLKCATQGGASPAYEWYLFDSIRGMTGINDAFLSVNKAAAEVSGYTYVKPEPTGFKLKDGQTRINASGETYVYIAIRRGQMAVPTSGEEVFRTFAPTFNGGDVPDYEPYWYSDFTVDMALHRHNLGSANISHLAIDRLRGDNNAVATALSDSESTVNGTAAYSQFITGLGLDITKGVKSDVGYGAGGNSIDIIHMWKRAPSFFDQVTYTGNGTSGRTVSHNLGVVPGMIWVKRRDTAGSWFVYHEGVASSNQADYYWQLNNTGAPGSNSVIWNNTLPTSTDFTLGNYGDVNGSGGTFIAYLFGTLDGVSKVGSYTGTGSAQNIDCGFTNGARFVIIRSSNSESWYLLNTVRGFSTNADTFITLEDTAAEVVGGANFLSPYSAGFTVEGSDTSRNQSGVNYIFYAIA